MQNRDIWALQQAQEIIDMVQYPLADKSALVDLVKGRVLTAEARGALRQANESRLMGSVQLPGR